eukprot:10782779-Alexandrium_andersonii.AAC.1
MSASLVGSEMCIRDSASSAAAAKATSKNYERQATMQPIRALFIDIVKGPVSYTHLTLPTICSV